MKDETPAFLHDIIQAGLSIQEFVNGRTFENYTSDSMLRSAVERKFEIMGEALNRIKRADPDVLAKIRNQREIISFRNILIHGYDNIDDRIVWGVIQEDLEELIADAEALLA